MPVTLIMTLSVERLGGKKKKSRKFLILKVEGIKIQKMLARKRVGGFHCSRGNGN